MSDDDIKPVAVLCETAFGRYWSTNIAVKCLPLGDYYDQSAIDRLRAERNEVQRRLWVAITEVVTLKQLLSAAMEMEQTNG